ncbi:MAG: hypothetical protein LBR94_02410 [Desulfovibrio sp.]|jgi:hypothetical protein|nr:hypothetical protein [Desulfovibrio sp.]
MDTGECLNALTDCLKERHSRVMALEAGAMRRLEAGDTQGYIVDMRAKAELLAKLDEDAKPLLAPLPGELRFKLALALDRFASGARTALRLNSVFYMSALLYPDEHKEGMPDNLMAFIGRLEREGGNFQGD